MQVKKQLLEMDMEERIGFNLGHTSGLYVVPCLLTNLHAEYVIRNAGLDEGGVQYNQALTLQKVFC